MTAEPLRRDERLGLRVSESDKAMLAEAADAEHTTVSSFVLAAARARAEEVLADRRTIRLSAEAYDRFVAALDEPPADKPRLRRLLADDESPFDRG